MSAWYFVKSFNLRITSTMISDYVMICATGLQLASSLLEPQKARQFELGPAHVYVCTVGLDWV